ncbi:MAG: class II fructose-bisphosphate aldolase [Rhodoglobus sp.]
MPASTELRNNGASIEDLTMPLARTTDLIATARARHAAVPAFNIITMEHVEGIVAGAERAQAAVILQVSENLVHYRGGALRPLLAAARECAAAADVPVSIHLDHIQDETMARAGMTLADDFGVSSIMIDAAHLVYERNVEQTAALAARAHLSGLWVEAELGAIGGKDGAHAPGVRTDPDEASSFVDSTGVDGLAVAVGSSHAMTTREAVLDVALIERIANRLDVPLVLHGSSGVPDAVLRDAVRAGITKVNIGTALNVGFTSAIRTFLADNPNSTDPRKYLGPARNAIADEAYRLCVVLAS